VFVGRVSSVVNILLSQRHLSAFSQGMWASWRRQDFAQSQSKKLPEYFDGEFAFVD